MIEFVSCIVLFTTMNSSEVVNQTTNSTISATIDYQTHYNYITFGVVALVANLAVALVLLYDKEFLKKSALMSGLCLADILNGCSLIVAGSLRLGYVKEGTLSLPVHPFICMIRITILWTAAGELPALMMLLIGGERALAIIFFQWYYFSWTNRLAWTLTGVAYLYCCCTITTLSIVTYLLPNTTTTPQQCISTFVIGPSYTWYDYLLAILCGTVAIISTMISLLAFNAKRRKFKNNSQSNDSNMKSFLTKQWNLTISMSLVSFFDFTLVVIPNVLKLVASFYPPLLFIGFYASYMVCTRSALSLVIYILTNRDFRNILFQITGINKNSVTPSTRGTQ